MFLLLIVKLVGWGYKKWMIKINPSHRIGFRINQEEDLNLVNQFYILLVIM